MMAQEAQPQHTGSVTAASSPPRASQPVRGSRRSTGESHPVRRRPAPVCQRQGPQELRLHQPDHPRLRQEEDRADQTRTQRSTPRRPGPASLRCADQLTRRPRLLRPAPRPRHRPPRRTPPTRQPTRRHPPRLPPQQNPLQRTHRLGAPPTERTAQCRLTSYEPGVSNG